MAKNKKIPKTTFSPDSSKLPKLESDPSTFSNTVNISWQLGLADWEGNWGVKSISEKVNLIVTEKLIDSLGDINNDVLDALYDLADKCFDNLDSFLDKFHKKITTEISHHNHRLIIQALSHSIFYDKIYPKLKDFEGKNWNEIQREYYGNEKRKTKHHAIPVDHLVKDAQNRLKVLGIRDIDELFSLRLDGKFRIFGIRKFGCLQIIWFDPNHEICPA